MHFRNWIIGLFLLLVTGQTFAQITSDVKKAPTALLGSADEINLIKGYADTVTIDGRLMIVVLGVDYVEFYDHDTLEKKMQIKLPGSDEPVIDLGNAYSGGVKLIVCHNQPENILVQYGNLFHVDAIKKIATVIKHNKSTPYAIACSTDPNKVYILEGRIKDGYLQPNLTWLIERDVSTMKVTSTRSFAKCFGKISRMNPIPERAEIRSLYSVPFESNRIILGLSSIAYNWPLKQECPDPLGYGGGQDTELAALYFIPEKKAILRWFNPSGMSDAKSKLTLTWNDSKGETIFKKLIIPGEVINAVSTLDNAVAAATDVGLYYTPDVSKPFVKITDEVGSAVLLTPKGTVIFGNEQGTLKKFALPK